MKYIEYIKTVKRRCDCDKGLIWYKKEYKERIPAERWEDNLVQLVTKTSKYKTGYRYVAECEVCGKCYLGTTSKKEMIEKLKYLGFGYKEKTSN